MQYKKLSLLFYLLITCQLIYGQIAPEDIEFISPIDFPIYLSGNYGEIRSGHFHAGIDIKTQGVTGKKIHAVEDGYISRIKISANSYGKTLYINHPNGYTTVYGHLNEFNDQIAKIAKNLQYQNNEFEINYFPNANELPVKKGQIIAFSGNTGSSEGPHLHFEVRETIDQIPVNPLLFNFEIEDNIPPVFYSIYFYPLNNNSKINHLHKKTSFKLKMKNGIYSIADTNQLFLSGEFGIGIEINDYLNNSHNKCGIYSLALKINNQQTYSHLINKIPFNESAYIKSHIDYAEKQKSKKSIQKTYISPNNNLSIYKSVFNRGKYNFCNDTLYDIKIIASDTYGNKSTLIVQAKGNIPDTTKPDTSKSDKGIFMNWDTENVFENSKIKIIIPAKSLYDSINFEYSTSAPIKNAFSKTHHIHNKNTPIHKNFSISIKTENLPKNLSDKAFIANLLDNNSVKSIGGKIVNDYIVSQSKTFGNYTVLIDTISPVIKPLTNNNTLLQSNKIKFIVKDDLSGIKSYNGYIDNNWALFEYDLKNDLLFYFIDKERIKKNIEHELELFVIDNNGNISTYYTTFFW